MVTFAILMAAESCQGVEEIMDTQSHPNRFVSPGTEHGDVGRSYDVGCWTLFGIGTTTGFAQVQQRHCYHRQQSDHRLDCCRRGELQVLSSAAGLLGLVI